MKQIDLLFLFFYIIKPEDEQYSAEGFWNRQSKCSLIDVSLFEFANDLKVRSKSDEVSRIKTEQQSVIISVLFYRVILCVFDFSIRYLKPI